ncbi:type I polyketide synthase [Thermocatellispora tengchongensis]|uniref:type I polyketide synthase n=1 Tax=Thermocatellispora tengchongensis TaxID=1073253 RepID=UPI0036326BC2
MLLKPLPAALADGDHVYCVIRGGALAGDGPSRGQTTPSAAGQAATLRAAYRDAGVDPAGVQYVELHGTGTPVGDPIEAAALGMVFAAGRPVDRPLLVGSVKTNVGHLEGAAGITGLIKTVLAIAHREIPPSLNFARPNPRIAFSEWRLRVADVRRDWPAPQDPLLAGVSSFGVGGTNCHIVLAAPPAPPGDAGSGPRAALPLIVSGRSEAAMRAQARRLAAYLRDNPEARPLDVAHTLDAGRSRFAHRAAVVGAHPAELADGLEAVAAGDGHPGAATATAAADVRPVFVFPGQGSQWAGMGRELMAASPVFRRRMLECADALGPHVGWSLPEVLGDADALARIDVVQPVLWAVMVSLAEVWRSYGVEPAAVVGHSQGEIAAACVAGALSTSEAARLIALRSRVLAEEAAGTGAMISLSLPLAEAERWAVRYGDALSVAVVNGPASVVLAGETEVVHRLHAELTAEGVWARLVNVDIASHSPLIEPAAARLTEVLGPVTASPPDVPFHSTVTGARLGTEELDAAYWYRNLRQTVRFDLAIRGLLAAGHSAFVELSPHPVTTAAIKEIAAEGDGPVLAVGSLRRDEGGPSRLLLSIATAHAGGVTVDLSPVTGGEGGFPCPPTPSSARRTGWRRPARPRRPAPPSRTRIGRPARTRTTPGRRCAARSPRPATPTAAGPCWSGYAASPPSCWDAAAARRSIPTCPSRTSGSSR